MQLRLEDGASALGAASCKQELQLESCYHSIGRKAGCRLLAPGKMRLGSLDRPARLNMGNAQPHHTIGPAPRQRIDNDNSVCPIWPPNGSATILLEKWLGFQRDRLQFNQVFDSCRPTPWMWQGSEVGSGEAEITKSLKRVISRPP